jgi:aminoglycoside phosphotransferase (APT) family kinase protein
MILHTELDPHAILQGLGVDDVLSVTPVTGGSDTAIWRVEREEMCYALRIFQQGTREDCRRERLVMQAAREAGLPVPLVHAETDWQGYPVLLLEWMAGRTVAAEMLARPWKAWRLGVKCGAMQAAIHAVPAPEILCQRADDWLECLGPGEQDLRERLGTVGGKACALLHLDFHPFNLMTDGKTVTAVLDWRNARAGDPRADAARVVAILQVDIVGSWKLLERALRSLFVLAWRAGYRRSGGSLTEMNLFYAWAGVFMELDLAWKRGPKELRRIQRWTARWKRRAEHEMRAR